VVDGDGAIGMIAAARSMEIAIEKPKNVDRDGFQPVIQITMVLQVTMR